MISFCFCWWLSTIVGLCQGCVRALSPNPLVAYRHLEPHTLNLEGLFLWLLQYTCFYLRKGATNLSPSLQARFCTGDDL